MFYPSISSTKIIFLISYLTSINNLFIGFFLICMYLCFSVYLLSGCDSDDFSVCLPLSTLFFPWEKGFISFFFLNVIVLSLPSLYFSNSLFTHSLPSFYFLFLVSSSSCGSFSISSQRLKCLLALWYHPLSYLSSGFNFPWFSLYVHSFL